MKEALYGSRRYKVHKKNDVGMPHLIETHFNLVLRFHLGFMFRDVCEGHQLPEVRARLCGGLCEAPMAPLALLWMQRKFVEGLNRSIQSDITEAGPW